VPMEIMAPFPQMAGANVALPAAAARSSATASKRVTRGSF
jgi:hypothetical protein